MYDLLNGRRESEAHRGRMQLPCQKGSGPQVHIPRQNRGSEEEQVTLFYTRGRYAVCSKVTLTCSRLYAERAGAIR